MPESELIRYYNRLPQWRIEGAVYFVTWRIHSDVPGLQETERTVVAESIEQFIGRGYTLYGYVVMDDHVHVIVQPSAERSFSRILQNWKSFSGLTINRKRGLTGSLWQKDSFTRIIRDEAELLEKLQYILNNPVKRWPGTVDYPWAKWFRWQ